MSQLISQILAGPEGITDAAPQDYIGNDRDYRERELLGIEPTNTKAGVRITHANSLNYSPVWRAVSMISGDVARLPLHLYRRWPDDTIERARDHLAYKTFRRRPNSYTTAYRFWRQRMVEVLLWGASYSLLIKDGRGRTVSCLPLCPDRTCRDSDGQRIYFETEIDGRIYRYDDNQILYLEWMSLDAMSAVDVVKSARETWAAGLAAIHFTSKFFGRGGRLGGILEVPAGLPQPALARIEEGFRKQYETADAAFQTVVLRENAKFHSAQATFEQAQMVEGRREAVRDVARFYGMAPSRLGEESGSSYNSKAEDNRDYLDTTLAPFLTMITSELIEKTLSDAESWPTDTSSPEHYWEHNTNDLLRMDAQARFSTYAIGITNGILSPNDARRAENMNPRPGGDSYGNPWTTPGGGAGAGASGTRKALAKLLQNDATRCVTADFDRLERKADKPRAFQEAVEKPGRVERFAELMGPAANAWRAALGEDIGEQLVAVYRQAIEQRLGWVLDNVPAATLASEMERIRAEALQDLQTEIQKLTGVSDADPIQN